MKRTIQHAFGGHRNLHHAYGAFGDLTGYWLAYGSNTPGSPSGRIDLTAAQYAKAVEYAGIGPVGGTPYGTIGSLTNPQIVINYTQYQNILWALNPKNKPLVPQTPKYALQSGGLKPVPTVSIKSALQRGGGSPVQPAGNLTMTISPNALASTRPRYINTTPADSVPTADQVTQINTQSIDPALVSGDQQQPSDASVPIPILLPQLTQDAQQATCVAGGGMWNATTNTCDHPLPPPQDVKILGMSPPVAVAVGIGTAAALFLLLKH